MTRAYETYLQEHPMTIAFDRSEGPKEVQGRQYPCIVDVYKCELPEGFPIEAADLQDPIYIASMIMRDSRIPKSTEPPAHEGYRICRVGAKLVAVPHRMSGTSPVYGANSISITAKQRRAVAHDYGMTRIVFEVEVVYTEDHDIEGTRRFVNAGRAQPVM